MKWQDCFQSIRAILMLTLKPRCFQSTFRLENSRENIPIPWDYSVKSWNRCVRKWMKINEERRIHSEIIMGSGDCSLKTNFLMRPTTCLLPKGKFFIFINKQKGENAFFGSFKYYIITVNIKYKENRRDTKILISKNHQNKHFRNFWKIFCMCCRTLVSIAIWL